MSGFLEGSEAGMTNRISLPPPALTQHLSGNVYFSSQQMQEHADKAVEAVLKDQGLQAWKAVLDHYAKNGVSPEEVEKAIFGRAK